MIFRGRFVRAVRSRSINSRTKCPQTPEQNIHKLPNALVRGDDIWYNTAMKTYKSGICQKMKKPKFKMVLTAIGKFAYRRKEDDVVVCPLSALKN